MFSRRMRIPHPCHGVVGEVSKGVGKCLRVIGVDEYRGVARDLGDTADATRDKRETRCQSLAHSETARLTPARWSDEYIGLTQEARKACSIDEGLEGRVRHLGGESTE